MNNKLIGNYGEEKAAAHLEKNKYTILQRNYVCRLGEIDIIAAKDEYIVFVEVKARSDDGMGLPLSAVDAPKRKKIIAMASEYILKYPSKTARFDIIEVYVTLKKGEIMGAYVNHIENAYWRE